MNNTSLGETFSKRWLCCELRTPPRRRITRTQAVPALRFGNVIFAYKLHAAQYVCLSECMAQKACGQASPVNPLWSFHASRRQLRNAESRVCLSPSVADAVDLRPFQYHTRTLLSVELTAWDKTVADGAPTLSGRNGAARATERAGGSGFIERAGPSTRAPGSGREAGAEEPLPLPPPRLTAARRCSRHW